jgi:UDP-N-acetyl-D-mannosaminuronate dehydrogenase
VFYPDIYDFDPLLIKTEIQNFDIIITDKIIKKYDCLINEVMHNQFKQKILNNIKKFMYEKLMLIDFRRIFSREELSKKDSLLKNLILDGEGE